MSRFVGGIDFFLKFKISDASMPSNGHIAQKVASKL